MCYGLMHRAASLAAGGARPGVRTRSCGGRSIMVSSISQMVDLSTLDKVERLGASSDKPTEAVRRSLDVIAEAFVSQPCTALYLADPASRGLSFWRTMAEEILLSQPADNRPLYVLMSGETQPFAAALAYTWRPGQPFSIPRTDAMVRPELEADWEACGDLWYKLLMDTYNKYGAFINIDFIGVVPGRVGGGLGRRLLDAILHDADMNRRAAFLAACGRRNEEWYTRHGFQRLHYYYSAVSGLPGHSAVTSTPALGHMPTTHPPGVSGSFPQPPSKLTIGAHTPRGAAAGRDTSRTVVPGLFC
ncbi:hypothetical protein VOLCADRAFT_86272 [Volvox carteri f. nagariensis]|uniref:N-acetyltransferase domain-containing protein n=1 Tax=Volvox carteri f. nagariensis TaxID=3068 RepID=D8TIC5_VOLCA|nr:uncharacterized protein VOLCADRAFT_86272 [Volvox carteri f. nagariensis]EFJ52867.1 hypothetical protein VOLCADRAFT_86272 [Volvox carteri f. nagariensis]|eukprot:XP_002945872.1 hypothetical protein VOLCADRAFT_86272 [Volvox carteri f. nagariensis]